MGKLHGMGSLTDKLYHLDCKPTLAEHATIAQEHSNELDLWDQRLGHIDKQALRDISKKNVMTGIRIHKTATLSFCEECIEGKMCHRPFKPGGEIHSTRKLQLVYSDVCGPVQTESVGRRRYFVTFIDDFRQCCAVYFMRNKSEVLLEQKMVASIYRKNSRN